MARFNLTPRALVFLLVQGLSCGFGAAGLWAQTAGGMVDLGTLGEPHSAARSVSADGRFVVGWSGTNESGELARPTLWDQAGTATLVPVPHQLNTQATAISADGTTVVGTPLALFETHGFRWSIGTPAAAELALKCAAVSADGRTVGGKSDNAAGGFAPALWTTSGGFQSLHLLPGVGPVQGLSADGTKIVGRGARAYRYDFTTATFVDLGSLGGGALFSEAFACSADASVVVGRAFINNSDDRAFRWTPASGMQDLGTLGGTQSHAYAVSRDGQVIVGSARNGAGRWRAFRWTAAGGMQDLGTLGGLRSHAFGVSADGSVIVGSAQLPNGEWRAFRQVVLGEVGTRYCTANANSTGSAAQVSIAGSPVIAEMNFSLVATDLPATSFGFFLCSPMQAFVAFPGGSQGNLCLGGAIGRFVGPGQVQSATVAGTLRLALQPLVLPSPTGPIPAQIGALWCFQAWYRDANPGATSNFTDAVSVTLQ